MAPFLIYHGGRHGTLEDGRTIQMNSMEAFDRALQEGAYMIEFDVWHNLQISHNPGQNSRTPKLQDVLSLINARCAVNIDLKTPALAITVMDYIDQLLKEGTWDAEQFVVSAFHHESAIRCKKRSPHIRVGVLNDGLLLPSYLTTLKDHGIDNIHLDWSNIYMDIEDGYAMKKELDKHGMQLWAWTVNTPEVFRIVSEYGVSGVVTDLPKLLVAED